MLNHNSQGFTGLNRRPKVDDPKNRLVLSFLSAVDMLQPKYVIMENVRGILTWRLGAEQVDEKRVVGGVPQGMVKLFKRALTGLG